MLSLGLHIVTCIWYAIGSSRDNGWKSYYNTEGYETHREYGMTAFLFWYACSARWVLAQLNGKTDLIERRNLEELGFTVLAGLLLAVVMKSIYISVLTKTLLDLAEVFKEKT